MKCLVFAQNYKTYVSGNYHQDLLDALNELTDAMFYGPGFEGYNSTDTYEKVLRKLQLKEEELDLIVVSTNWEKEQPDDNSFDLQPTIRLDNVKNNVKKIFFLNKEYKKIEQKLEYIKRNKFDLVITVLPQKKYAAWEKETGVKFMQSHFGINSDLFKNSNLHRKYDFTFTGSLHSQYTNKRVLVKEKIFRDTSVVANIGIPRLLNIRNPIKKEYRKYNIYWAEWSKNSKSIYGKSLLPTGNEYVKLMNESKVFLSTLSADGILGTRFFEIMSTGALLMCPEDDYYGVLQNEINCVMYKNDLSNFDSVLRAAIEDKQMREKITLNAQNFARKQNYQERVKNIFNILFKED